MALVSDHENTPNPSAIHAANNIETNINRNVAFSGSFPLRGMKKMYPSSIASIATGKCVSSCIPS